VENNRVRKGGEQQDRSEMRITRFIRKKKKEKQGRSGLRTT
jgi:hypothetical protein